MDYKALLQQMAPLLEPMLEQGVNQLWVQVDAEIATLTSPDVKLVLQALSPAMKGILISELQNLTK